MKRLTSMPGGPGKSRGERARDAALAVALGAAVTGCKQTQAAPAEAPSDAVHVETVAAREQPMPRSLQLTGTLRGKQQTDLAANANGRVVTTLVERGSAVSRGDLLATIDVRGAALTASEARANAELARTQGEVAKRECDRYQKLLEQQAVSPAEYDKMSDTCRTSSMSIAAAAARSQAAALVVGDGAIRAPFSGVVTERYVEVGEYVHQDSKVVSLVTLDPLKLELTVPEASVGALKEGGALSFTVPAFPGRTFAGTVRYVGVALRETTRDLVAEAVVENPDHALRPGMFATVALFTGEAPVPVLPASALVEKDGLAHVFAVVDRRLEERVVQTGVHKGEVVAIVRGVKTGDAIVEKPTAALHNGQAVN